MAESRMRVALSPLTHTIYAGRVNANTDTWAGKKYDVTNDVLGAVIQKVGDGNVLTISEDDVPTWEILVRRAGAKPEGAAPQADNRVFQVCGEDGVWVTTNYTVWFNAPVPNRQVLSKAQATAQQAESGAQAASVKPWQERMSEHKTKWHRLPPPAEDFMREEIADLRAALAAQSQGAQAARTLEIERDAARNAVKEYCARIERLESALAAKAEAPMDDNELARLRRVVRALGMEKEVPQDDTTLRGCLFSVLGMIALRLERAQLDGGQDKLNQKGNPMITSQPIAPKRALYALTPAEHAAVLAALRHYQLDLAVDTPVGRNVQDIATNCGTVTPLDADDIDDLCVDLNHSGLDMGGVCEVIGRGPDDPYVKAARRLYPDDTIDERPVVSESDDGAYVMTWTWINKDEVENG